MPWSEFANPARRCRACGLFRRSTVIALPGEGPEAAQIALIGEGPGEEEEAREANFIGRAGEMLDGCIAEAGLHRSECWVANAVRCRPAHEVTWKNRKPTMHEVDCCRGYTLDELRRIQPRVIVALGDTPMTSLIGKQLGGVTSHRGKVRWSDEFNAWVVITFHPAYALRTHAMREFIVEDLRLAKRVLDEGAPPQPSPIQVDVITTLDAADAAKRDILQHPRFVYDWETNGTHPIKSRGFCVSICVRPDQVYVFPPYLSGLTMFYGKRE